MIKTLSKTQISFAIAPSLKKKALKKAREKGVAVNTLFASIIKTYLYSDYYDDVFADQEVINKANKLGKLLKGKNL